MKLLNQLSRITTAGRAFIPQIDGLRFVAIMAVIAFHIRGICSFHFHADPQGHPIEGDLVNDTFSVGFWGVQLFFIISGFILSLPFARQWLCGGDQIKLRDYYVRRITRIEPPYVIHLVFLFALCALVLRHAPAQTHLYQNPDWAGYSFRHILPSLFYANGFIYGTHPYPNVVLWSLEVEVQFYLLAPFLAGIFKISGPWRRRTFIVLFILLGSLVSVTIKPTYLLGCSLLGNIQYFLTGFLLADIFLLNKIAAARNRRWDLIFPAVLVCVVALRHWLLLPFILPWLMFACCLAAFRGKVTAAVLSWPWIATIGGMCYTIYLYHFLMISLLIRGTGRLQTHVLWLDLLIQFVLMSVIIIGACAVLFVLFERPFMRRDWPARVWGKFRPAKKIDSQAR